MNLFCERKKKQYKILKKPEAKNIRKRPNNCKQELYVNAALKKYYCIYAWKDNQRNA